MPDVPVRKAVETNALDDVLREYARAEVRNITTDEVIASLKTQGITSLESLVEATVGHLHGGGQIARESFIYEQFIYRKEMPVPTEILRDLRTKLIGKVR